MTYRTEQLLYRELRGRQFRTNILKYFVASVTLLFLAAGAFGFIVKALGL